jgi:hypothetical protein
MKKLAGKLFRPTNRGVRLLVGLLLAGLGLVQVAQTIASREPTGADTLASVQPKDPTSSRREMLETLAATDHLVLLTQGLQEFQAHEHPGYRCTFLKQERIRGTLGEIQKIDVKFLADPFSVVMTWTENAPTADKILYVEGQYKNAHGRSQMVARPASAFLRKLVGGSVLRLPDGPDAMKNTLRPCTLFGFENSLTSLIEVYEAARKQGQCNEQFGEEQDGKLVRWTKVGDRLCLVLVRYLPYDKDYPAKKTVICLDAEWLIPLRVKGYDWDDQLTCDYQFLDVNFDEPPRPDEFTPQANGIHRPK